MLKKLCKGLVVPCYSFEVSAVLREPQYIVSYFLCTTTHIDFTQGLNVRSSVLIIIMRNHWDIVLTDRATTVGSR